MQKLLLFVLLLFSFTTMYAQVPIQSTLVNYTVTFDASLGGVINGTFEADETAYTASNPAAGQLDSDAFQTSSTMGTGFGWPAMPEEETDGQGQSDGLVLTDAGVYSFTNNGSNRFLGVYPNVGNYSPGAIIMRAQNQTTSTITQFDVSYTGYYFDKFAFSTNVAVYWSNDGTTWFPASGLNFESPALETDLGWESEAISDCIMGVDVAPNEYFYLKWVIEENSILNLPADPVGIDDITLFGRTPEIGFTVDQFIVQEGTTGSENTMFNLNYTITAPPIGGTVTVSVATTDGTATTANDDYVGVTIPSEIFNLGGDCYPRFRSIPFQVKKDNTIEPNENFFVNMTLSNPGASAIPTGITSVEVIIANDDGGGKIYSQFTGNWSDLNMWNTQKNGNGTFIRDPNNVIGDLGPQWDVVVQDDHIVTLDGDKGITFLTVEDVQGSGTFDGQLLVGNASPEYSLIIYDNSSMGASSISVDIDGILGNGNAPDGLSLDFRGTDCEIIGEGEININRIRKSGSNNTDLSIETNLTLRGTGTVLYSTGTGSFDCTINNGVAITLTDGDVSLDGENGINGVNSFGTLVVLGSLILEDGNLYLKTDNTGPGTDIEYEVRMDGQLSMMGKVFGNNGNSGTQTATLELFSDALLQLSFSGLDDIFVDIDDTRNVFNFSGSSIVEFNGILQQIVPPQPEYGSIQISESGFKKLSGNTQMKGSLILDAGRLELGPYDLTIGPAGETTDGSQTSYVLTNGTGVLKQTLNDITGTIFPVGNGSFNPVSISITDGPVDQFSVRVDDEVLQYGNEGPTITSKVVNRTWFIDEAIEGDNEASINLQWNASDELMDFIRGDCFIAHYRNSGGWETGNVIGATSLGGSNYRISATNFTDFSPFIVSSPQAFLPVELLYFKATRQDKTALLQWETASESNNSHFVVERSNGSGAFTAIGQVAGQGTTSQPTNYDFTDRDPLPGVNYYRLRQVDEDGQYEFSPIRSVQFDQGNTRFEIYPNPTSKVLFVEFAPETPSGTLQVINANGQVVQQLNITANTGLEEIDLSKLPSAVYWLQWESEQEYRLLKFVKE